MSCVIMSIVGREHLESVCLSVQYCGWCCLLMSLFVPVEEEVIVSCCFLTADLRGMMHLPPGLELIIFLTCYFKKL